MAYNLRTMQMTERQLGTVIVLDIAGTITQSDADRLRDNVIRILELGHRHIVLDLAELTHLDSAALGSLVASQIRADKAGTSLKLANAGKRLSDLLVITRLVTVFDAYDSLPAALASFSERR